MEPKYKKGDIITDGEHTIVVTDTAIMKMTGISGYDTEQVVYRGQRISFHGPLLLAEKEVAIKITEEADMWDRNKK